jgi:predicted transposase YdaD
MVFSNEADQQWLEGEVAMLEDIVRDTWFYQKILKEGLEEGREEGILETLRLVILDAVEERFPAILKLARARVEEMHDPLLLRKLNTKMVVAQTAEEAERAFRDG